MKKVNKVDIKTIVCSELVNILSPWELEVILSMEQNSTDLDIFLDNMLDYLVEMEFYEHACAVRDAINNRKVTQ